MFNDTKEKWYSLPVKTHEGKLEELKKHLPEFRIHPFGDNQYLNCIERLPIGNDQRTIPVATVSKKYALIQHKRVLGLLQEGTEKIELDIKDLDGILKISQYGERMHLAVKVPTYCFDPGDGFTIEMVIDCFNSVDKSCAMGFDISWVRLVCTNGMRRKLRDDYIRKVHLTNWFKEDTVAEFLENRLASAREESKLYRNWMGKEIDSEKLDRWIEKELSEKWGKHQAFRALNVMKYGSDGRITYHHPKEPFSEWKMSCDIKVPGACAPVDNLFHVSQALSWIAGEKRIIETRLKMLEEIPDLIADFDKYCSRNLMRSVRKQDLRYSNVQPSTPSNEQLELFEFPKN